jgi:hypothetical protein
MMRTTKWTVMTITRRTTIKRIKRLQYDKDDDVENDKELDKEDDKENNKNSWRATRKTTQKNVRTDG